MAGTGESDVLTVGAVGFDAVEGEGGAFFMDGGANNDVLAVGAITLDSYYTVLDVTGGAGDDQITIASLTCTGQDRTATVSGATGADTSTFTGQTEKVTVDLGVDTDMDRLVFRAMATDVLIANWDQGIGSVDVFDHTTWFILSDDWTETVLSDGTSKLSEGVTA